MDKNFKDIFNSSNIKPPKGLRQAVFERIEKEKMKKMAQKRMILRIGFAVSGISSVAALAVFGKEVLSSEFSSLILLGFSDMRTVTAMWQDYAYSLMETLPTASITMTLLPIFTFMILLRQYGKLEQYNKGCLLKH